MTTRILAPLLLAAVFLVSFALLVLVGAQWWENRLHLHLGEQQASTSLELDAYRDQADMLQRLASLLIGLSSLYAVVLGVTSYVTAQQFVERSKESADRLQRKEDDFEKHYPLLAGFSESVTRIVAELTRLLPHSDDRAESLARMSPEQRQHIVYYESSVAYFEFLDVRPLRKEISEIYRSLGKFYGAHGASMRKEIDHLRDAEDTAAIVARMRDDNRRSFYRARLYLEKALQVNPENFSALNDLGYLLHRDLEMPAEAEKLYDRSLDVQPRQQRARYNLAVMYMDRAEKDRDRADYQRAERLLSEALRESNWQMDPVRERVADIRYNRACCWSRLAEGVSDTSRERLLDRASADLLAAVALKYPELTDILKTDTASGGDLRVLATARPEVIERALREMGDV